MAEFNDFFEEEHILNLSERELEIPNVSQNAIHSDSSENADDTEYDRITDAIDRAMQKRQNIVKFINELEVIVNSLLQQKEKLAGTKKELKTGLKDVTNDLEKTVKDSDSYFLMFREVYKKCESGLDNLLQKAELRLNLSNIAGHYEGNVCAYFPILSKNPAAYTLNLTSAKLNFQEFQTLSECGSQQESENKINNLATAIDKAYIAYSKLRSIVFYED